MFMPQANPGRAHAIEALTVARRSRYRLLEAEACATLTGIQPPPGA